MNKVAHSLFRMSSKVWNTPQFITQEDFTPILQYLSSRNAGDIEFGVVDKKDKVEPSRAGKFGELQVSGSLTYKPVMSMCGEVGTSYQQLLEDAEYLIDAGVKTIILTHNSGGGEAQMMMTSANRLRELADENDVKLISYIETLSASASLGLGIVADEVIIHPEAKTGSVGAVVALLDRSKALADAGLKPIYLSSTEGKTPFAPDGSFSQKFLDTLQAEVVDLGARFAEHVSKHSGIPVEDILALDAQVFNATKAKEIGLVNKIMNQQEFAAYLAKL